MDPYLERYLELCKRMVERMERDGSWPWAEQSGDSRDSQDMVESEDNPKII